ncbi:FCD domain-containing protein [Streptomyces sp. NPDC047453]|uniref:FCD domain-containing protein n=1 Tax=Streptomyces sp. NPDC047453 TaxID=3154812 RepID=UPI0033F70EE5
MRTEQLSGLGGAQARNCATERDLRGMTADREACLQAFAARDVEAFVVADVAFHLKVTAATNNPVLSDLYGSPVGTLAEAGGCSCPGAQDAPNADPDR